MHQLLIFSSMPPRPLNFWNCPTSLDPTNLLLIELRALPRSLLILLALACNLVTTGTRTVLAERIFECDWVNKHGTQHVDPHPSAAPTDSRGHWPPMFWAQWGSGLVRKHTAPFPHKPYQQRGIQRFTTEPATSLKYYTRWRLFTTSASAQSPPGLPAPSQLSCISCSPSRGNHPSSKCPKVPQL